jgi:hypothetical protein
VWMYTYSGTNVISKGWLNGTNARTNKCTDATSSALNTQ